MELHDDNILPKGEIVHSRVKIKLRSIFSVTKSHTAGTFHCREVISAREQGSKARGILLKCQDYAISFWVWLLIYSDFAIDH